MTITTHTAVGSTEPGAAEMAEMARQMFGSTGVHATLDTVAQLALVTFGCDAVTVSLSASGSQPARSAATDADSARANVLVEQCRQGPGRHAIDRHQPVIVMDLRSDSRWRFWAPQAADLGFRSVLSIALADGDTTGALTLYSRRTSFFHSGVLPLAAVYAQHASIAVAIASERHQLLQAFRDRKVVGQAQGILMERYDITAEQSRTVLSGYSVHLDQSPQELAERVVLARTLPDFDESRLISGAGPASLDARPEDPRNKVDHFESTGS